jgi:large subunit ribosomal protein L3
MIGIIGKKKGMTQLFDENGNVIPVSVIEVTPNVVVRIKTVEKDGYSAGVLGVGIKKYSNRPYSGIFKACKSKPTQILREIRDPPSEWKVGDKLTVSIFSNTKIVNITGYSKGKGFAGVMKRYGWAGGPASHGSKFHRKPGSVGTMEPKRTIKGHGLPGRLGNEKVTVKNLELVKIDEKSNLIYVKGAVPGAINSWLIVKDAKT